MTPVTLPATWADDLLHDAALLAAIVANTPSPEAMQATARSPFINRGGSDQCVGCPLHP
jgi:hypothetical protein